MTSPYQQQAQQAVSLELDPSVNALRRQLAMLEQQRASQQGQIQNRGQLTEQSLSKLYTQLAGTQNAMQQQQSANYGAVQRSSDANYDSLTSFLGQNRDNAVRSTSNELQRLGIEAVAPEALREIQRDGADLQGLAQVEKANAATNNNNNRLSFEALLSGMRANTDAEKTQQLTGNRRQTDRSLGELQSQFGQNKFELSGKLGDLESRRSLMVNQKIQELIGSEPSYEDQLDVALKKARLDDLLNPRESRSSSRSSSAREKAAKTPRGRDAAYSYLQQVGGKKADALTRVFQSLESGNAGEVETFGFSLSDPQIQNHIRRKSSAQGWGGAEQNALRQAMAIYFGKG